LFRLGVRCNFPRLGVPECVEWKLYGIPPSVSWVTGRRCGLVRSSLEIGSAVISSRLPADGCRLEDFVTSMGFAAPSEERFSRALSFGGEVLRPMLPLLLSFRDARGRTAAAASAGGLSGCATGCGPLCLARRLLLPKGHIAMLERIDSQRMVRFVIAGVGAS